MSGPNVLLLYRNMAKAEVGSNIGLGVNALHTVRVLRRAGVVVEAASVAAPADVRAHLVERPGVTHCIIEAPWVPRDAMADLLRAFPKVHRGKLQAGWRTGDSWLRAWAEPPPSGW